MDDRVAPLHFGIFLRQPDQPADPPWASRRLLCPGLPVGSALPDAALPPARRADPPSALIAEHCAGRVDGTLRRLCVAGVICWELYES